MYRRVLEAALGLTVPWNVTHDEISPVERSD